MGKLIGRTIRIKPHGDVLNLRDPDGTGTFETNDPGEVWVGSSVTVNEDVGTAELAIHRSGGSGAVSVDWHTEDDTATAGVNYTASSGTANWADGDTATKYAEVPIEHQEGADQGDLDFLLKITNPVNAVIRTEDGQPRDTKRVTIRDLDEPTSPEEPTVIWNGDFSTGDVLQWHQPGDPDTPRLWFIPEYGRPAPWGNNELAEIVTDRTRGPSPYAIRLMVKNGANWSEPEDCGPQGCSIRRTNLNGWHLYTDYKVMTQFTPWIFTFSVFIPEDWDPVGASSRSASVGFKPKDAAASGWFAIKMMGDGADPHWRIRHRHDFDGTEGGPGTQLPWQQQMIYHRNIGLDSGGYDNLVVDFPNPEESRAALATFNKGGWTDWIVEVLPDWRKPSDGGTGFLRVYKREDDGPLIHVIDAPALDEITIGSETFPRGIGYNTDYSWVSNVGFYAAKEVWENSATNQNTWWANIRVYDGSSSITAVADHMVSM